MHVLIMLVHPEPHAFNAALADDAQAALLAQGHTVERGDLYQEGFNPIEGPAHYRARADPTRFAPLTEQRHAHDTSSMPTDIECEIARLWRADRVIFQFPLWWHAQPAMLKGWFDRVFVYGRLYTGSRRYDRGIFTGKKAICSVTTGGPASTFTRFGRGGPIERLLWPIHYSLYYMGFDVLAPFLAHGIQGGGIAYQEHDAFERHLAAIQRRWGERLAAWGDDQPIPFSGWDDWTDDGELAIDQPQRWL